MKTDVTIKLLASELKIPVESLISQFADIGIQKADLDYVSQYEKRMLFMHINRNKKQVGVSNKLTLQRKIRSTLNVFSSGGKSKKVQVEVRKRRTYVKCEDFNVISNFNDDISCFKEKNLLSDALPLKRDVFIYHEDLKKNTTLLENKNIENKNKHHDNYRDRKLLCKNLKEKSVLSKNSILNHHENQIKSDISSSFKNRMKKNLLLGNACISSNKDTNLENNRNKLLEHDNNKKKLSSDRRFRDRHRSRSLKLRSINKNSINKNNASSKRRIQSNFFDIKDERDELRSVLRGIKHEQRKVSTLTHAFNKPDQIVNRDVVIGEMITVAELANKMAVKSSYLIKMMIQSGMMATINQVIDQKTAQLLAEKVGHHVILRSENDLEDMIMHDRNHNHVGLPTIYKIRSPIVTIMGHVDHGKTSLLDSIRSSKVVDSEAGGITQHIGAYCVETSHDKKKITFLDTPGHAAFTSMRMRGVQITDLVILVVAVDDGVMLQTIEAIQHVKRSKIPVIVALSKIDKGDPSNIHRVKSDLAQRGIISEEWGGETQFVNISTKLGIGIDNLLNAILLEAELLDLKVVCNGMATGVVFESYLDKGKGPVASVLIREGTLKCGDVILCGLEYGRVRSLRNDLGDNINFAGPSLPVEVFGLSGVPCVGDVIVVVRDERKAREVALYRKGKFRAVKLAQKKQDNL